MKWIKFIVKSKQFQKNITTDKYIRQISYNIAGL